MIALAEAPPALGFQPDPEEDLARARAVAANAIRDGLRPPTRLRVSEWAEANRVLGEISAEPGPWRNDKAPYLVGIMDACASPEIEGVVFMKPTQVGGALELSTPIPTPGGWKAMGDLVEGDTVFDERGQPCRVTTAFDVIHGARCYRVEFSDGTHLIADAGHKWYVESGYPIRIRTNRWHGAPYEGVFTTEELLPHLHDRPGRHTFVIPVAKPLQLPEAELPVDPYVLGAWLGDGNSQSAQITAHSRDLEIADHLRACGVRVVVRAIQKAYPQVRNLWLDPPQRDPRFCIRGHDMEARPRLHGRYCRECHNQRSLKAQYGKEPDPVVNPPDQTMTSRLSELGVLGDKHVPEAYLRASADQRLALLQGLMDTDGHITKAGRCEFSNTNRRLADAVMELARSLGLKPTIYDRPPDPRKNHARCWRVSFLAYRDTPVFRLSRKLARQCEREGRRTSETERRRITDIKPVPSVPVRCIEVDSPSHLYLAGEQMVPTHNSEVLNNVLGYYIDQEPAPILFVLHSLEEAKKYSKERIAPMIEATPCLRARVADPRSRDSENTVLSKAFTGGHLGVAGANSPAALRSRARRILLCDEVDGYPPSAGAEGDPIDLAIRRTATFWNRLIFLNSTPTLQGLSRIETALKRCDEIRHYHVPCPHCGHEQRLVFENLKWDKVPTGSVDPQPGDMVRGNVIHRTGTAAYACAGCGAMIEERLKRWMLRAGDWVAEQPAPHVRWVGFRLNALYSPWVSWQEMAWAFLEMKDNPLSLQVFVNTFLGDVWEEKGNRLAVDPLMARREEYDANPLPERALVLTAGVDVHADRLEVEILGWGLSEENWSIDYLHILGDTSVETVWGRLDQVLARTYDHPRGVRVRISATAIDSGYAAQQVWRYAKDRMAANIWAVKGFAGQGRPIWDRPTNRNKLRCPVYPVGVDTGKSLVYSRLRIEPDDDGTPTPGYCHFPTREPYNEEHFRQLTAEKIVVRQDRLGRMKREWIKLPNRQNHVLDVRVYATAAFEGLVAGGLSLQQIAEAFQQPGAPRQGRRVRSRGVA